MNTDFSKTKHYSPLKHIQYLIFFASIIFSLRGITSIGLGLMLLIGLLANRQAVSDLFQKRSVNFFLAGCIVLFLLQLIALLYTQDKQQGWNDIRIKSGLVITPLAIFLFSYAAKNRKETLLSHYCLFLAGASLYCLCIAFLNFRKTGLTAPFFYHDLVGPIKQHAVYFSILVTIGLIFLLESLLKRKLLFVSSLHIGLVIYLSAFLFLLSSKLVIIFYIVYLVFYFIQLFLTKNKPNRSVLAGSFLLCIVAISLLFTTRNPISSRFYDIVKGNINIVKQESFTEDDYFNGLQFRLLQWRFVGEILTENKRWWLGVSPGDAQTYLNKKYLSKHMYAGDPSRGDHGYLIYNTHNQFLETLLQNGITGLVVLMGICFFVLKMAIQPKNRIAIPVTLLLLTWLFTESVFETQYGIVLFTFFSLFIYTNADRTLLPSSKANLLKTNSDI